MQKIIESDLKVVFQGIENSGKKITREEIKKSIERIGYKPEDIRMIKIEKCETVSINLSNVRDDSIEINITDCKHAMITNYPNGSDDTENDSEPVNEDTTNNLVVYKYGPAYERIKITIHYVICEKIESIVGHDIMDKIIPIVNMIFDSLEIMTLHNDWFDMRDLDMLMKSNTGKVAKICKCVDVISLDIFRLLLSLYQLQDIRSKKIERLEELIGDICACALETSPVLLTRLHVNASNLLVDCVVDATVWLLKKCGNFTSAVRNDIGSRIKDELTERSNKHILQKVDYNSYRSFFDTTDPIHCIKTLHCMIFPDIDESIVQNIILDVINKAKNKNE